MDKNVATAFDKVIEERDARNRLKKRQRKLEKKLAKVQRKLEKTKRKLEQRLAKVKRKLQEGRREAAAPAASEIAPRKTSKRVVAKPKKIRTRAPKRKKESRAARRTTAIAPAPTPPAAPNDEKEKMLGS